MSIHLHILNNKLKKTTEDDQTVQHGGLQKCQLVETIERS